MKIRHQPWRRKRTSVISQPLNLSLDFKGEKKSNGQGRVTN